MTPKKTDCIKNMLDINKDATKALRALNSKISKNKLPLLNDKYYKSGHQNTHKKRQIERSMPSKGRKLNRQELNDLDEELLNG